MSKLSSHFDFVGFASRMPTVVTRLTVGPREIIFRQGEPAEFIWYLISGQAKLSVVSPQGKEAILAVVEPDEFFGESCLLGHDTRYMTATGLRDSTLIRVRKESILELMAEDVNFDKFLITHLLQNERRIEDLLLDQIFNSSEKRLARALLTLANYAKKDTPDVTIPKLSQEMLAEIVGSTRPRINQFMNKFRKQGYIDYNSSTITIHNSLLRVLLYDTNGERSA
jgi:CRP/FNR family cyclic AMP-dependent transcriptional regulator